LSENTGHDLSNTKMIEGNVLTYRLRLPAETTTAAPVLIMIHGYGANDGDIYELVPFIDPKVVVVAPRAPLLYSDDPRGSFKWSDTDIAGLANPAALADSVQKILGLIEKLPDLLDISLDLNQLFVGGFSQGGILAYALVSRRPDLFAGVIAHSAPFNPEIEAQLRATELQGKPFFVAHGRTDNWVALEQGQTAVKVLQELGAAVEYHEYDFAHETSIQSRRHLADWLAEHL
jgi:phospholipase/carboxylesterase